MLTKTLNELDPGMLQAGDLERMQRVLEGRPRLVGRGGFELELPDPIFHLLLGLVRSMREGKTVLLVPEDEDLTTQAAANYLGVSRPFLIGLLEGGQIPHYKVGTHRRVRLRDLRDYERRRDERRREDLDALFDAVEGAGKYE